MKFKNNMMLHSASIALLSATLGMEAVAQVGDGTNDEIEQSRKMLSTITVTANKRSESVQEIPVSVNALSGEMLDEFGIEDGDDILQLYPNDLAPENAADLRYNNRNA